MENLDSSLLEGMRNASTCVSDFSISLEDDSTDLMPAKSEQNSEDGSDLTTDFSKVTFTLGEVICDIIHKTKTSFRPSKGFVFLLFPVFRENKTF